jgi:DNA helicase HerA-like ATPase
LDAGIWLDLSFPHVVGIFGSRGSGKSFDLGVIAESVAGSGGIHGSSAQTATCIIFDVQDQFWTIGKAPNPSLAEDTRQLDAIARWGLTPSQVAVQLWATPGYRTPLPDVRHLQISPSQLAEEDWLALLQLERFSPLGQALLTLVRAFPDEGPRRLAVRASSPGALPNFQSSTVEGVRWRLESLGGSELIGGAGVALDDLLVPGSVSVVLMRQLGDALRSLLVGVLTRLIADRMSFFHQQRRVTRRLGSSPELVSNLPDRLWLFLDEAHVVVPAGAPTAATDPVIDYVKRGRDAGLSMVFATQQPSAVDPRLMSQVDMTFTHFLGFEADLQAAVARMPTRSSFSYEIGSSKGSWDVANVLRSLDPGECLVADAASGRVFAARIRPRVSAHGGNTPS